MRCLCGVTVRLQSNLISTVRTLKGRETKVGKEQGVLTIQEYELPSLTIYDGSEVRIQFM